MPTRRSSQPTPAVRLPTQAPKQPFLLALVLLNLQLATPTLTFANDQQPEPLPPQLYKNGDTTLAAFKPISESTRNSIAKLDVNGSTVALAAVIDTNGLALTKASELKPGTLTAWLASGREVKTELLARDDQNDLALVRIAAPGLIPIRWTNHIPSVGQWVITPGVGQYPQAVGIVSGPTRRVLHPRALIGIQLDPNRASAKIAQLIPGFGAEKAGLKPGDIIVAVNNTPITEADSLTSTLREFQNGQSVKLTVRRDSTEFEAVVKLKTPEPDLDERPFDRSGRMNRMGTLPSARAEGFQLVIPHDTTLQNRHCGGPLVTLDGLAVGLNIARAGRVASYALPAALVQKAAQSLKEQAGLK